MTNAEKCFNTIQQLHANVPAPFNPDYKPEVVKRHKQYHQELRDYQDTIDDSASNEDFDKLVNNYNRYLLIEKYPELYSHCEWFKDLKSDKGMEINVDVF